jgi:hypothetical protein
MTQSSLRFNRCKIIDTEESDIYNKATRTIRVAETLLLLRKTAQRRHNDLRFWKVSRTSEKRDSRREQHLFRYRKIPICVVFVSKHKHFSNLRQITEILGHNFWDKISIEKLNFYLWTF